MDVVFSTASILNLFCISLYRWFQIVRSPETYHQYFTKTVVILLIISCWVVSFIIAIVPIYTNIYTTQDFLINRDNCRCDFIVNQWYALVSSSVSFWLPSAGIIYFYYQITMCAIEKHRADIKHQIRRSTFSAGSGLTQIANLGTFSSGTQGLIDPLAAPDSSSRTSYSSQYQMGSLNRTISTSPAVERNESLRENINAAKTLLILLVVYLVCWFPFFLTYIIDSFTYNVVPDYWITFVFWLGYCNSAVNPFIYAVKFKEFQPAFLDTLGCLGLCTCCNKDVRNFNSSAQGAAHKNLYDGTKT
ncbi:octopamine receptor beta-3R isoform X2 [Eurytemora carolleeae]|uniref:octopamine receptor beta-3R isoform X2 n=1 Tax=Eurytemora carolleeae TaxID=1294199 RepID=UPI000C7772E3|nr:octopamine receptor beta-3R isoform X2 [Eurytemora carolleeae]|eukprot:XP_023346460.1 octopamine receptor beta-3R-like isoform X2 [Eurytemora affinis]